MSDRSGNKNNVILIVLDTLRADFLSSYGGHVQTPAIDSLAQNGVLFEKAFAAGPGSSISHGALFSGQYPSNSGIVGRVDVPENIPWLPSYLKKLGYDTFGLPGVGRTSSQWGYNRGFNQYLEKWHDIPSGISLKDLRLALQDPSLLGPMPKEIIRSSIYGDDKHTSYLMDVFGKKVSNLEEPFFAFANFPTVHGPYDPPRPYKESATPELKRRRLGLTEKLFGKKEFFNNEEIRLERIQALQESEGTAKYFGNPEWVSDKEIDILRDWYAALIEYLDGQLQELFTQLKSKNMFENSVIILTADHGEYFGEHNMLKHMYYLFEECLHVPLIISGPELPEGERRTGFVSLIDIFDTICDVLDIDLDNSTDGESMFANTKRSAVYAENGIRRAGNDEYQYMSREKIEQLERGRKAIRTDDYLYTLDSQGETHLYKRPGEVEVSDDTLQARKLHQRLLNILGENFKLGYQQEKLDPDIKDNLRELGYI